MLDEREKIRCPGCIYRNLIIDRQNFTIQWQKQHIARLRRIIQEARQTASDIQSEGERIMAEHQPRGRWGFARGAVTAAQAIAKRLAC